MTVQHFRKNIIKERGIDFSSLSDSEKSELRKEAANRWAASNGFEPLYTDVVQIGIEKPKPSVVAVQLPAAVEEQPLTVKEETSKTWKDPELSDATAGFRNFEKFIANTASFLPHTCDDTENEGRHSVLSLVYDSETCNDYAKSIMRKAAFPILLTDDAFKDVFPDGGSAADSGQEDIAAKRFIEYCREPEHRGMGYEFLFWALMVLTVDESDAERHLDRICSFAKMLCVTDDAFEDIIQLVKATYMESAPDYEFKSEEIPEIFSRLIRACGWETDETPASGQ